MKRGIAGMALGLGMAAFVAAGESGAIGPEDAPDTVDLDALVNLYEKVSFDHAMHVGLVDCFACHHQTTGTKVEDKNCVRCHAKSGEKGTVACRDCHVKDSFEASYLKKRESDPDLYHIDKPGLKAAYHLNCLECHKSSGAPTGCTDCHPMREEGEKFFHSGKFAPAGGGAAKGHH